MLKKITIFLLSKIIPADWLATSLARKTNVAGVNIMWASDIDFMHHLAIEVAKHGKNDTSATIH